MPKFVSSKFFGFGLLFFLLASHFQAAEPSSAPARKRLDEPERVIRRGDMIRITLKLPGRTFGSLERVEAQGDVATPEGSFVKAAGLTLAAFRVQLSQLYASASGYEEAQVEAYISSSPYVVVMYPNEISSKIASLPLDKWPPPTVFRRNFNSPLTLWEAIQKEGGLPFHIDPHQIRILQSGLARKILDCSGKDGLPDGRLPVESGDHIFLIPNTAPVSKIFEDMSEK